jgi:hypothetical protein
VKAFAAWCGGPKALEAIDNALLCQWEQDLVDKFSLTRDTAKKYAARIRLVINDWQPGRLLTRKERSLPSADGNTLQAWIVRELIPQKRRIVTRPLGRGKDNRQPAKRRCSEAYIGQFEYIAHLLHLCPATTHVPARSFSNEHGATFLMWCRESGPDGSSVSVREVDQNIRCRLMQISRAAVKHKVMSFRLALEAAESVKRRAKPSTNGHPASNGAVNTLAVSTVTSSAPAEAATTAPTPDDIQSVVLRGERKRPLVLGVEKRHLTVAEYDVVKALVDSKLPLTKDELDAESGHTGSAVILARLAKKDPEWYRVIYRPGQRRDGYRLRTAQELVNQS